MTKLKWLYAIVGVVMSLSAGEVGASNTTIPQNDTLIAEDCISSCSGHRYKNEASVAEFQYPAFKIKLATFEKKENKLEWCRGQQKTIDNCEYRNSTCRYIKWVADWVGLYHSCHQRCRKILADDCAAAITKE